MRLEGDTAGRPPRRIAHAGGEVFVGVAALPAARGVRAVVGRRRHQARDRTGGPTACCRRVCRRAPTVLNGIIVPGLHNVITRIPPVDAKPAPYAAVFEFNWLSASGTACFLASIADGADPARVAPAQFAQALRRRRSSSWRCRC